MNLRFVGVYKAIVRFIETTENGLKFICFSIGFHLMVYTTTEQSFWAESLLGIKMHSPNTTLFLFKKGNNYCTSKYLLNMIMFKYFINTSNLDNNSAQMNCFVL